ncbi:MAG: methanogen output domain 1-containing protein [Methanobacterium sp.]|uniref:methanogen output domain 1-containing protein n=1 Tax=Methanobacterium sp. TaxID=2164 RepID=UPI003D6520CC|nr:methanogen output domain 1-containing protein [Methanobacterium sp.]
MSSVKILVVEDESIVAMDIKHRLEGMDYIVPAIISSGEEAVEKAAETKPDLVLMDIVLRGDMDGIEAAQQINDTLDIPVVYLTAYSDEKTLKRAKITGPFGYIIKPFEDRELHSAIEVALYKHEMESKLKENEKWLSTTLESIGDAVITTNKEGNVTFMNPVARKITGWQENEALGKPLANVFKLVNEKTGEPIDSPVREVVQKGSITHMNSHTLLITKYGKTVPINDTNAPIIDNNNNTNGAVLVFQDITPRRIADKEKEQLLKEKARSELFGFLLSAMPVFASNIPPQIRNTIAKSFADRFETNMKPRFLESIEKCFNGKERNMDNTFNCYIEWIKGFLSNIGIDAEQSCGEYNGLTFLNCPWEQTAEYSPMFCLICRVIVIRSFTWTGIKGHVEQMTCKADGASNCGFQFILSQEQD